MSDGRYNIRNDGAMVARVLIDGGVGTGGIDADDDPVTVNPVVVGGVYFADPAADPIDDGDVGYVLLTDERRVVTQDRVYDAASGTNLVTPVSADTDDAAVVSGPLIAGGVYYSNPAANPIDDGDAGYLLLTDERRVAVQDRVYDGPTDANRSVPVWSVADLYATAALGDSLGADGTVTKYVSMQAYLRWSIQYAVTHVAAEVVTLKVSQSNDDVDDPTTATYQDVTNPFFSVAGFTADSWIEPENPTSCVWLRVQVTVSGWTSGTVSWTAKLKKLAQA